MSNFSENQELNNSQAEEALPEEELSTIFSDPTEHKPKKSKSNKKRLLTVIASVLAVAILAGTTVAVVKLIPEKEEGTTSNPALNEITVLKKDTEDFKTVSVSNANGDFSFYKEIVKEEEKETTNWYLSGYNKDVISVDTCENIVGSAASVTAFREIDKMTLEDCGLVNPEIIVRIVNDDGSEFSINIGKDSLDNSGCYLKISDSERIYLTDSSIKETFTFTALDCASTNTLPAFEIIDGMGDYVDDEGALLSFDTLTVSGNNFSQPIVIKSNDDEELSQYIGYLVTSPTTRVAEDDSVVSIFGLFKSGLTVSGAYSFDVSDKSLKSVGLDNPDFIATIKIKNSSLTYKFKAQEDGYYAVICDKSKLISKVAASNAPFAEYKLTDFYSSWVCLISIDDLSSFVINVGDTVYDFGITAVEDEEAEEDLIVTLNGKKINTDEFKSFYQKCISLACTDFTVTEVSGQPQYKFTFNFNAQSGGGKTVTEFYKASETRYQYKTDGVNLGKVTSSSMKQLISALEELTGK